MKITFLGAAEEVTGSKFLVEHDNIKILVDCGLYQGSENIKKRNREEFSIEPSSIHAIVLTHAHIDHTGYIPLLVKRGFRGRIYCSKATYALCAILLKDTGFLQEGDARRANAHGDMHHVPILPLYTQADAEKALTFFHAVDYDILFSIDSLKIKLIQSFHILGSSFVVVSDGKKTLSFSGDLGRPNQLIMKSPPRLKQTDFLVLESTYGNKLHEQSDPIKELGEIVNKAIEQKGVLIIPAFAVERTQTVLYCLYQLMQKNVIPKIPIYLDSPMAIHVNDLFSDFKDEHNLSLSIIEDVFDIATYVPSAQESKYIDYVKSPAIIIAGSGMADGGRVLEHFTHFISDAKNTVAFVGFLAEGTHGKALVDGVDKINIYGQWYPVRATIKIINSFSAHADYREILEWLSSFETSPKKVFLTHGELEASLALKKKIEERFGWPVVIPKYLESFNL